METLVIQNQLTEVAYILKKIKKTVNAYTERYPELMYISTGIALVKKQTGPEEDLNLLIGLNEYIREKLFDYHVIRTMYHKLVHDIEFIKTEQEVSREKELYLEFSSYKEMTPIK